MKRTVLPALLASVLVLSGCGNSEDEEAKTAISDYFTEQGGQQGAAMKEKEADCLADGMVDDIGVDQLKEYKILEEDGSFNEKVQSFEMSEEDAEVMADSFLECTDTLEQMKAQVESAPTDGSPETQKCFDELLGEENVRSMLVASFSGDQEKAQEFQTDLMKCASAGMPAPGSSPTPAPEE